METIKRSSKTVRRFLLALSAIYPIVVGFLHEPQITQAKLLYYPAVGLSLIALGLYSYRNIQFLQAKRKPPVGLIGYLVLALIVSIALALPLLQVQSLFLAILPSYIFTVVFLIVATLTE